ncbi:hypothetical protein AK812_SmicGene44941 [Symbiodinium microadriaticum]|uniref:Uncharacterized protein n=1 Tax=Symbiodinium microadriaticum TaxID=2951 RepID=A0A1Q9BXB5_SYMMI|nr:hypothetical protein AK812_SmicGene44941 [Symbiodinium microadriaticum]
MFCLLYLVIRYDVTMCMRSTDIRCPLLFALGEDGDGEIVALRQTIARAGAPQLRLWLHISMARLFELFCPLSREEVEDMCLPQVDLRMAQGSLIAGLSALRAEGTEKCITGGIAVAAAEGGGDLEAGPSDSEKALYEHHFNPDFQVSSRYGQRSEPDGTNGIYPVRPLGV